MYFGSSYYPPHHDERDWARDLDRMAKANLRVIRSAELLATWDMIEKEPGEPDFSWIDRLFELAQKHDIRILLGTGACNPPIWMLSEYPDLQILSRDNIPYPTGGMWSWACINHPAFLRESDRYLVQLLERYKDHPALLGWQIHNEPGYPFVPRKGQDPDWYCYNPHTVERFRRWLEQKYEGDIDALNDAWRWDPTNHRYRTFDEVRAPRVPAMEWGVLGAWLDWRTFTNDNWTELIRRQHQLIKSYDPDKPTMTNLMGEATDFTGRLGVDPWKLAGVVDAIGFDLYPGLKERGAPARGRPPAGPHFTSWFLDFGASVAMHNDASFWLPEMESGPLDGWTKGPRYTTEARDIRRWGLQSLAHGASMLLYQGYREWNCIPIHWGALVDLHGEPTGRYDAAAQLGKLFSEHSEFLERIGPPPSDVAVLYNHANVLATGAMDAADYTKKATQGLYEALWRGGHRVDYVSPDMLDRVSYRVLLLPYAMQLADETCRKLRSFVDSGGILIGFARCAMLDERGWLWNTRPGGGLDEVFGVTERWIDVQESPELTFAANGGALPVPPDAAGVPATIKVTGAHHRQDLDVAGDCGILARYNDGAPAVTRRHCGKGVAIYFGTHFDLAAAGSSLHAKVLSRLLENEEVVAHVGVTGAGAELVDAHLLIEAAGDPADPIEAIGADRGAAQPGAAGRRALLIVCNEAYEEAEVWLEFSAIGAAPAPGSGESGPTNGDRAVARDLITGETVPVYSSGDRLAVRVTAPARDGMALLFGGTDADG